MKALSCEFAYCFLLIWFVASVKLSWIINSNRFFGEIDAWQQYMVSWAKPTWNDAKKDNNKKTYQTSTIWYGFILFFCDWKSLFFLSVVIANIAFEFDLWFFIFFITVFFLFVCSVTFTLIVCLFFFYWLLKIGTYFFPIHSFHSIQMDTVTHQTTVFTVIVSICSFKNRSKSTNSLFSHFTDVLRSDLDVLLSDVLYLLLFLFSIVNKLKWPFTIIKFVHLEWMCHSGENHIFYVGEQANIHAEHPKAG